RVPTAGFDGSAGEILSPPPFLVFRQYRSSTSFQVQIARLRFSADSGHIAASHRLATKSADARQGAADDGELHQAAKPTASIGVEYKRDTSHRCGKRLILRLVTIAQTAFSDSRSLQK